MGNWGNPVVAPLLISDGIRNDTAENLLEINVVLIFGGMVLLERFELSASPLPRECSTPEL